MTNNQNQQSSAANSAVQSAAVQLASDVAMAYSASLNNLAKIKGSNLALWVL